MQLAKQGLVLARAMGVEDVRHQRCIEAAWQRLPNDVQGHDADSVRHIGLSNRAAREGRDFRVLDDRGLEIRVAPAKGQRIGSKPAAHIEQESRMLQGDPFQKMRRDLARVEIEAMQ